jgi:undecaprenyl diphosphate synthase
MAEKVLRPDFTPQTESMPKHIAIIMDGNGRWAKHRHLPRIAGHKAGVEAVRTIVKACGERGVKVLTLFAFSSENWQRPRQEIQGLMQLFISALKYEVDKLHKNSVQLRFIGNLSRFSEELRLAIQNAVDLTANNTGLILVIALDYGGQWDIVQATQQLSRAVLAGKLKPEDINVKQLQLALSTKDLPAPDLFIRTSGELRLSNFLLWQLAYTELYFTDVNWPDFDVCCLENALQFYAKRERRFGGIGDEQYHDIAHA